MASSSPTAIYDPSVRDEKYQGNFAKYVVDLHDSKATFNFCGGMMFQLVLSDKLRERLSAAAAGKGSPLVVHEARHSRMSSLSTYKKNSAADDASIFHGREVRNVAGAAGGMGFVLHLSDSSEDDPEGWSPEERDDYDGWGHDGGRPWRKLKQWEDEGVTNFREKFGGKAYGLHHRCFWHLDNKNRLWLSAEDGCEGFAAHRYV